MELEEIINNLCKTFCKCCNMCESLLFGDNEIEYSDLRKIIDEWNEKASKYLGGDKK